MSPPARSTPALSLPRRLTTQPIRLALTGLAALSLLLAACDGTDAADDASAPTETPTASDLPTDAPLNGGAAGGGIEPANPEEPPEGVLNSGASPIFIFSSQRIVRRS